MLAGAIAALVGGALMVVGGPSVASADPGAAQPATAGANGTKGADDAPKKVFVCKYVGKPGVDERLKDGKNPISVSVNSIKPYEGVGSYFADAQGRSYVVAEDDGQPAPDVSECAAPDAPSTTTTTTTTTTTQATPTTTTPPVTDWEWQYQVTCSGVSGSNPNGPIDSVDSNIKITNLTTGETRTFNYHPNTGGDAGFTFTLADYGVPSTWQHIEIQWVQVNGTNYHWEGALQCGSAPSSSVGTTTTDPTTTVSSPSADPVVPAIPTVTESQCVDHAATAPSAHLPADGNHITYGYFYGPNERGFTAKATLDAGYTWGNLAGTGWVDKGNGTAALHRLWEATPDCNEYVTPAVPDLNEICSNTDGQWTNSIVAPAATDQIVYAVHGDGLLYAAIQQSVKGYTFFDTANLPAGWAKYDAKDKYLVFTPTYQNGECRAVVDLASPDLVQPTCATPGSVTLPADTDKIDYYFHPDNGKLVAKLKDGYELADPLAAGWVASSYNRAVFTPTYDALPDCSIEVVPANPTVTASTGCGVDDVLNVPAASDAVSYVEKWNEQKTHVQVVAHAADGYYFDTNGESKTIRTWEFDVHTLANGGIDACPVQTTDPVEATELTETSSEPTETSSEPVEATELTGQSSVAAPSSSTTVTSAPRGSGSSSAVSSAAVTISGDVQAVVSATGTAASTESAASASPSAVAAAAVAPIAGPPSATAKTGETANTTAYLLFAGGVLLLLSGLWSRRRGTHAS
ncbi:hypothetical protein [Nakamurella lactea]|uniref:hypothetical protein n=1 Tax=Nakamurella lactea TaxID=459515 RepID=UPI00048FCD4C|nr:hypothetical protein [Nakamurella lactea]